MSDDPAPGFACELCWEKAYERMHLLGGDQMTHYVQLLRENDGRPGHDNP